MEEIFGSDKERQKTNPDGIKITDIDLEFGRRSAQKHTEYRQGLTLKQQLEKIKSYNSRKYSNCETFSLVLRRFVNFLTIAALPVAQLIIGVIFKDEVVCETNIVSIPNWLIIKGSSVLFMAMFSFVFSIAKAMKNNCIMRWLSVFCVLFYLSCLFNLGWLIVGSVVFWRDCNDLTPKPVNTMMWCSLIIDYVLIYIQLEFTKKEEEEDN